MREERKKIMPKLIVFYVFPFATIVYGFLIFLFAYMSDPSVPDVGRDKLLLSAGLATGVSGLFSCVAMSIYARKSMPEIIENPGLFGKHPVVLAISMTGAVYGLCCSILPFLWFGVLAREPDGFTLLSYSQAQNLLLVFGVFAGLSIFSVLKGYLPTRVEGDMTFIDIEKYKHIKDLRKLPKPEPDPVFKKRLITALIGEVPLVVGYFIVIFTLTGFQ